jgi:hypothetical protein
MTAIAEVRRLESFFLLARIETYWKFVSLEIPTYLQEDGVTHSVTDIADWFL